MIRSLIATLLSGSFALQLLLAGAGSTCVMPSGAHETVATSGAAAEPMRMTGMDMSDMSAAGRAPTSLHDHGDGGAPCERRGTPRMCQVMASCAGGFVVAESHELRVATAVPAVVESSIVTAPASRSIPPELPPPRA
jgi:hypothetical protein